ncbi:MAG: hypothetical protein HY342_10325, partial [Candidatus Lambdaproteobacteria bacterium]|nr:hypothetical protein [Candidatus Lambdaproteobacteria bacterium]
ALERDPAQVLLDVQDDRVSVEQARKRYGVVIDADAARVDLAATRAEREALRRSRGPIDWVFDHGPRGRHNGDSAAEPPRPV